MAVRYVLSKVKGNKSPLKGKWLAHAKMVDTIDIEKLSDEVQASCSVKKSDVVAVLTELVYHMTNHLQNSQRVKLNGFGSFKVGLRTKSADSPKDFKVSTNIVGLHVIFQPEVKTSADGTRTKTFLTGTTVKEYDEYAKGDDDDTEAEGGEG
jgi:predicted histone-like DNA-binding protein